MGVQGSQAGGQEGKRMSTENQKFRNLEIQKFSIAEMQILWEGITACSWLGGRRMGGRGYGSVMGLTG